MQRRLSDPSLGQDFYWRVYQFTRDRYDLSLEAKLKDARVDGHGADFVQGLPREDLLRALLWHAVYKPVWNPTAAHGGGPSWSWASLSQRVGWPDFSLSAKSEDVIYTEIEVAEEEKLILTGPVATASFALQDTDTQRKGFLTSDTLLRSLSCIMDCDFTARAVLCLVLLTRQLSNEMWCTHCLVLEPEVEGFEEDQGLVMIPMRYCRRAGTAKVRHMARDAKIFMKTVPERIQLR